MTDINTTLRGNQQKKEDPKSPGTIAKKIFKGLFAIVLAVAHDKFLTMNMADLKNSQKSIVFDLKSVLDFDQVDARL